MAQLEQEVRRTTRKWWTRVRHAGAVERPREWADAQAWAGQAVDGVVGEQGRVREQFAEIESSWFAGRTPDPTRVPREHYYHAQAARYCAAAGWCFTLLEAVIAGGLSILLFTMPVVGAVVLGVAVTALLAVGLKGWVAARVARYHDRPKEGRDNAVRVLTWTAPVFFGALAVLFLMRGLAGAWVTVGFPIATAVGAIVIPIIAAALLVLAGLYGWSTVLTRRYRALEQAHRDATELRDAAARGLTNAGPRGVVGGAALKAAVPILCLVAAGWAAGCSPDLQAAGVTPAAAAASAAPAAGPDDPAGRRGVERADIWVDDTASVDERDRPQALDVLTGNLLDLSDMAGIHQWQVYGFGDEPWREAAFHQVTLPRWEAPPCEPLSEASRVFKLSQAQQAAQCTERTETARRVHAQDRQQQIARLRTALGGHRSRPARCSGITDLLARVAQTPARAAVIIISDGVETCRAAGLGPVAPPVSAVRVIWVLVGSAPSRREPTLGEQFSLRRDALLRAAPWLTVVAPWQLGPELLAPSTAL